MIEEKVLEELRSKYNPEGSDLRLLQLRILDIFKCVDEICRRNDIPYWLGSGTLLGAVRHKGFIPWDDDLDIEILRKDRARFIEACKKELPDHLHVQCHETEPDYYLNILKVRDDTTDIGEKINLGELGHYDANYKYKGYFVDIFCEEHCVPIFMRISNKLLYFILSERYVKKRSRLFCNSLYWIMNALNGLFRVLGVVLAHKDYLYHGYSSCFLSRRKYKCIFPNETLNFEGIDAMTPHDVDGYLKDMFGNYMELPKEKLRSGHHSTL